MPTLSAILWTDCVTGCWLISVFMFISWASECVCNARRALRRSTWHVWEGGCSHVLRPSAPPSILVWGLSLWWINARHRQAARPKLWAGLFRKKKKILQFCPLHNGQCSAHKVAILSAPPPSLELRRCSCAQAADDIHNENVLLGTADRLSEQFHLHRWIIKGVTGWFSGNDCSDRICIPQDWCVISN